jgi:uncharacterized protein YacL
MALIILRCICLMVAIALGLFIIKSGLIPQDNPWMYWGGLLGPILLALGVIGLDVAVRRKQLDVISAIYFGLIVGLFMAYVAFVALTPLFPSAEEAREYFSKDLSATARSAAAARFAEALPAAVQLTLGLICCYVCISLLMQTRHDFRFIIPYVEFSREVKGSKPCILDTSVVIDGRIADVVETQIFDSQLIMPRFVISELQAIADSSDRLRRSRGRRGLDILNRLRTNPDIDLEIFERELPEFAGQSVDLKLVILAKHIDAKLVTNDYNLNKVARLQGIHVVNLNDLANALKPVFLPGEQVQVRVVKPGEEPGQGVGYLEDGTMVVVESGREHINEQVTISVTSVLQTSAGRMVFGRYEGTV